MKKILIVGFGDVAERYLKKGAKVYIEGALESRKFTDSAGAERETTEVVLKAFRGELTMLDGRNDGERQPAPRQDAAPQGRGGDAEDDADSIPF